MKQHIFVISILVILSFGCDKTNNGDKNSCAENSNAEILSHNDETREYILYVPNSYDGTTDVPLMFNFHGFGGSASWYMDDADMRALADSENFILVYPQGTCLDGSSHWNPSLSSADKQK